MQTDFSAKQLADPAMAVSESVIRKCVHCGFCTATCPTYVLLGDELDSPRGRIYLMKEMLEKQQEPTAEVVKHIDRCLSCLSCMTTCPSGVNYMHLVDHARAYIEERYDRGPMLRIQRALLAMVLPYPRRFRAALLAGRFLRSFAGLLENLPGLRPISAMLRLLPRHMPRPWSWPSLAPSSPKGRVVLVQGCAEPVLSPQIREATARLLVRCGLEVDFASGEACCGALVHHMGRERDALAAARRNVDAWTRELEKGLDAIVITTSGCGTTIKNYGHMLRNEPDYAAKAAAVSALAKDVSELLDEIGLPPFPRRGQGIAVAYHPACSMQHGQKLILQAPRLLEAAGFIVLQPGEAHLCCGSAGTYNIFQPDIAGRLGDRKAAQLARLNADVVATGNIGCAIQIAQRMTVPVVHTIELLDWATGGPLPALLSTAAAFQVEEQD